MVRTDLARAALVALMAVPGTPFVLLCALLVLVQLLNAPFSAARAATLPAALSGDPLRRGIGDRQCGQPARSAHRLRLRGGRGRRGRVERCAPAGRGDLPGVGGTHRRRSARAAGIDGPRATAVTALRLSQGTGILLAGLAAESWGSGPAISLAGALGVLAAVGAGAAWRRADRPHIPAPPR
jgi:hypothetical protein